MFVHPLIDSFNMIPNSCTANWEPLYPGNSLKRGCRRMGYRTGRLLTEFLYCSLASLQVLLLVSGGLKSLWVAGEELKDSSTKERYWGFPLFPDGQQEEWPLYNDIAKACAESVWSLVTTETPPCSKGKEQGTKSGQADRSRSQMPEMGRPWSILNVFD